MADFLGGLLGGGGGLYDDLLTPQQQSRLSSRGLLAMAGAFADAGMPSRLPIPLGAAIGKAAAAMGAGRDEAALSLLKAGMTAQELKALQQKMKLNESLTPFLQRLAAGSGGGVPTPPAPAAAAPAPGAPGASATDLPPGGVPPGWPGPGATILDSGGYGMPPRPRPLPWTGLTPGAPAAPYAPLPLPPAPPGGRITPADYGVPNPPGAGSAPAPDDPAAGASLNDRYGGLLQASYTGAPPFGQTPGAGGDDEVGSGGGAPANQPGDPRGLIPYIRERAIAAGIDPDVAVRVAQSEGLGTFRSSVIQRNGQREPSYGAFQLYTGGGMGNDFQRDTGLDPSDPKNERATIDYALSKAPSTGWTPWHGAAGAGIGPRTGLPGGLPADELIRSGGSVPGITRAQYSGGLPGGGSGGGAAPGTSGGALATPPGAGAALATPPGGGVIPGTGMTPQQLGALNALMKMGGLGDPFNSLLETYYKSPGYLGEAASATERAQKGVALEYAAPIATAETKARLEQELLLKPLIESKIEELKNGPLKDRAETQAQIDRYSDFLKQMTTARTTNTKVTVSVGGQPREITVSNAQATDLAAGRGIPALGIPPGAAFTMGTPVYTETEKAIGADAAKAFGLQRDAAQAAAQQVKINNESLRLLDSGLYTGWDANLALSMARIFGIQGKDTAEKVQNTQLFVLQRMQQAAEAVKAQPGSASDKDLAFANRMALGDITLEPSTIRQGMEIYNRFSLDKIREHNKNAVGIPSGVTSGIRQTVDEPPTYERSQGTTPSGNRWTRPPGQ